MNLKFLPLMLLLPLAGCLDFKADPQAIEVHTVDGESGAVVPHAAVEMNYGFFPIFVGRRPPAPAETDAEGKVVLEGAKYYPQYWNVEAKGYLPVRRVIREKSWPDVRIIPLYRPPDPAVTLILPEGYRGRLAVEMRALPRLVQEDAGQRRFEYAAPGNGPVVIEATPLLQGLDDTRFFARYGNGESVGEPGLRVPGGLLPSASHWLASRSAVGLYFIARDEDRFLFMVGSVAEAEVVRAWLWEENGARRYDRFNSCFGARE